MNKFFLNFDILSFWHAGSGRGSDLLLNAVVQRDSDGLPYLPGRTVKGLVRDALARAEAWGHAGEGLTEKLFGQIGRVQRITRLETQPGQLIFDDARLPADVRAWLRSNGKGDAEYLFSELQSSAIDPVSGTAKHGSLRAMEVAVPMMLTAPCSVLEPPALNASAPGWCATLNASLPLIRFLGSSRTRGLGRVHVTMEAAS